MAIKAMETRVMEIRVMETRLPMGIKEVKDMETKEVIPKADRVDMVAIQTTIIMEPKIITHMEIRERRVVTVIVWRHVAHAVEP